MEKAWKYEQTGCHDRVYRYNSKTWPKVAGTGTYELGFFCAGVHTNISSGESEKGLRASLFIYT